MPLEALDPSLPPRSLLPSLRLAAPAPASAPTPASSLAVAPPLPLRPPGGWGRRVGASGRDPAQGRGPPLLPPSCASAPPGQAGPASAFLPGRDEAQDVRHDLARDADPVLPGLVRDGLHPDPAALELGAVEAEDGAVPHLLGGEGGEAVPPGAGVGVPRDAGRDGGRAGAAGEEGREIPAGDELAQVANPYGGAAHGVGEGDHLVPLPPRLELEGVWLGVGGQVLQLGGRTGDGSAGGGGGGGGGLGERRRGRERQQRRSSGRHPRRGGGRRRRRQEDDGEEEERDGGAGGPNGPGAAGWGGHFGVRVQDALADVLVRSAVRSLTQNDEAESFPASGVGAAIK